MARAVLNVATEHYVRWQQRLAYSIRKHWDGELMLWTEKFPKNSPNHGESPYAFKLFAMEEAASKGFRQVLWMDSGLYAIRPIHPIFEVIERDGYYLNEDQNPIHRFCSDTTTAYFNTSFSSLGDAKLVSGSLVGMSFDSAAGNALFAKWKKAYEAGLYRGTVSAHSGSQEHRGDETILGIIAYQDKLKVHTPHDFFCADGNIQEKTLFRSGYYERDDIKRELWDLK